MFSAIWRLGTRASPACLVLYSNKAENMTNLIADPESESVYLARIETALCRATREARRHRPGSIQGSFKAGGQLVTEADQRINRTLREQLLRPGEGWLSEEDSDDLSRLSCRVVWIVDPIDGTREFIDGIPEWSISIGLAIDGMAVVGGILNPATEEMFLGSIEACVTYNGSPCRASSRTAVDGAAVLASRQEYLRGEWRSFEARGFTIRPTGSIAYKLALVAAGLADATWTLTPKHEWDIAAGIALVKAAGGRVGRADDAPLRFNREDSLIPGLVACAPGLCDEVRQLI
jgi:myo-inositol-1(or 4)-monophosphatase